MPNMEHGFGAPSTWLDVPPGYEPEVYDLGFGSPTTLGDWGDVDLELFFGDTGFGSPLTILVVTADPSKVRDNGGQLVRAASDWPILGPYAVEILGPSGASYPCYGCVPGEGETAGECFTDDGRTKLTFATPLLPKGVYDLRITWFDGTQQTALVEDAITVHYRGRFQAVYELGNRFPSGAYDTGVASPSSAPLLGG